jgi:hypothetical protein
MDSVCHGLGGFCNLHGKPKTVGALHNGPRTGDKP